MASGYLIQANAWGGSWGFSWWGAWGNAWGQWTAEIEETPITGGGQDRSDNGARAWRRYADEDWDFQQLAREVERHRARLFQDDQKPSGEEAPFHEVAPYAPVHIQEERPAARLDALTMEAAKAARAGMDLAAETANALRDGLAKRKEWYSSHGEKVRPDETALALAFMEFFDD